MNVLLEEGVVCAVVCEREEDDEPGVEELEERWESGVFLGLECASSSCSSPPEEVADSSSPLG